MNGVFAEECSGLLQGQKAGVSLQPADLSTAAVFMLRLVPQLSLPVVLPVFLFPNSSSSPSFHFQFFFCGRLILSEHDTCSTQATGFPHPDLT